MMSRRIWPRPRLESDVAFVQLGDSPTPVVGSCAHRTQPEAHEEERRMWQEDTGCRISSGAHGTVCNINQSVAQPHSQVWQQVHQPLGPSGLGKACRLWVGWGSGFVWLGSRPS